MIVRAIDCQTSGYRTYIDRTCIVKDKVTHMPYQRPYIRRICTPIHCLCNAYLHLSLLLGGTAVCSHI